MRPRAAKRQQPKISDKKPEALLAGQLSGMPTVGLPGIRFLAETVSLLFRLSAIDIDATPETPLAGQATRPPR
jgi:hypothetical protein